MNVERMTTLLRGLFTVGAFVLLILAGLEKLANLTGQTLIGVTLRPSVLASYATMVAVFAILLVLAELRTELRNR